MDQTVKRYRSYRRSRRYTLVIFTNLIDLSALNASVLFTMLHPEWNPRRTNRRGLFLKELGQQLVLPFVETRRIMHVSVPLRDCIQAFLKRNRQADELVHEGDVDVSEIPVDVDWLEVTEPGPANARVQNRKPARKRCHVCPRRRDKKTSQTCSVCWRPVCYEHARSVSSSIFIFCSGIA